MRNLILVLALVLASCTKENECEVFDLGPAGESYEAIQVGPGGNGQGISGVIYVEGDRIKQEICYNGR
jgi:hypothetical protein